METIHNSQSEVASHTKVPFEARHAVFEQLMFSEQADVKQSGEQARRAKLVGQEYTEQVRKLMGSDKHERFRAYIAKQKMTQSKLLFPPRGPEMSSEKLERVHLQRQEESLAFLQELGVNVNQLKDLNQRTHSRLAELVPLAPTKKGERVGPILPTEVPADIRAGKTNPWTILHPPFPQQ